MEQYLECSGQGERLVLLLSLVRDGGLVLVDASEAVQCHVSEDILSWWVLAGA